MNSADPPVRSGKVLVDLSTHIEAMQVEQRVTWTACAKAQRKALETWALTQSPRPKAPKPRPAPRAPGPKRRAAPSTAPGAGPRNSATRGIASFHRNGQVYHQVSVCVQTLCMTARKVKDLSKALDILMILMEIKQQVKRIPAAAQGTIRTLFSVSRCFLQLQAANTGFYGCVQNSRWVLATCQFQIAVLLAPSGLRAPCYDSNSFCSSPRMFMMLQIILVSQVPSHQGIRRVHNPRRIVQVYCALLAEAVNLMDCFL